MVVCDVSEEKNVASRIFSRKLKIENKFIGIDDDNEEGMIEILDEDNSQGIKLNTNSSSNDEDENESNINKVGCDETHTDLIDLLGDDTDTDDSGKSMDFSFDDADDLSLIDIEFDEPVISFDDDMVINMDEELGENLKIMEDSNTVEINKSQVDIDVEAENKDVNQEILGDFIEEDFDFMFEPDEGSQEEVLLSFHSPQETVELPNEKVTIDSVNTESEDEQDCGLGKDDITIDELQLELQEDTDNIQIQLGGTSSDGVDDFNLTDEIDKEIEEIIQEDICSKDNNEELVDEISLIEPIQVEEISHGSYEKKPIFNDQIEINSPKNNLDNRLNEIIDSLNLVTTNEISSYFEGSLDQSKKEYVYYSMRRIEMQNIFEEYIKELHFENFLRNKKSVDYKNIENSLELLQNTVVFVYEDQNTIKEIEIPNGSSSFILISDLELDFEKHIDKVIVSKFNCEYVYFVVLRGTVVDSNAIDLANRYGIKIIQINKSISDINKNLPNIRNM